jgi:hypothetical protein
MIAVSNLADYLHEKKIHGCNTGLTPEEKAYMKIMLEQEEQDERDFYLSLKND